MGAVASYQLRRADQRMAKTLVFVKCAFAGDVAKLQEMMAKDKISPNAQDRFGMTALHWAAYGGKLTCVQELLKAGASLTLLDDNGRNALHHACRKDHDELMRFLVTEMKMDVNGVSESKDTPLHKAVFGKSVRCIEALLQLGADPTLRNDQNRTPLEELDAHPGHVKDVVPEPLVTARMDDELNKWRHEFFTEIKTSGRKRGSLEMLLTPKSLLLRGRRGSSETPSDTHHSSHGPSATNSSKYAAPGTSTLSVREVENTLVTTFRGRISEFSDRSSSRSSSAHFPTTGLWAKPSATTDAATASGGGAGGGGSGASSSAGSSSNPSTGRQNSVTGGKAIVVPINLQGLPPPVCHGSMDSATSRDSDLSSMRSQTEGGGAHRHAAGTTVVVKPRRKNLRYAGKRVIMAMRVKKCMTGDEKRELIRLLFLRHTKVMDGIAEGPDAVKQIGTNTKTTTTQSTSSTPQDVLVVDGATKTAGVATTVPSSEAGEAPLVRGGSGFTISLPPNL